MPKVTSAHSQSWLRSHAVEHQPGMDAANVCLPQPENTRYNFTTEYRDVTSGKREDDLCLLCGTCIVQIIQSESVFAVLLQWNKNTSAPSLILSIWEISTYWTQETPCSTLPASPSTAASLDDALRHVAYGSLQLVLQTIVFYPNFQRP